MRRHGLLVLVVQVLACRQSQPAPPDSAPASVEASAGPARTSFTCRKEINGKRTIGALSVHWENTGNVATVAMKFEALDPTCTFRAEWHFPDGLPTYRAAGTKWTPTCSPSPLSPFAISCDLDGVTDLAYVTQTLRVQQTQQASGTAVVRSLAFLTVWPSDVLPREPLPPNCTGLPIVTGFGGAVMGLSGEFASFSERECQMD
jgi:hypothetical protein